MRREKLVPSRHTPGHTKVALHMEIQTVIQNFWHSEFPNELQTKVPSILVSSISHLHNTIKIELPLPVHEDLLSISCIYLTSEI
jgi:hypothetical protein